MYRHVLYIHTLWHSMVLHVYTLYIPHIPQNVSRAYGKPCNYCYPQFQPLQYQNKQMAVSFSVSFIRTHPELRPFLLQNARPTGVVIGDGSLALK